MNTKYETCKKKAEKCPKFVSGSHLTILIKAINKIHYFNENTQMSSRTGLNFRPGRKMGFSGIKNTSESRDEKITSWEMCFGFLDSRTNQKIGIKSLLRWEAGSGNTGKVSPTYFAGNQCFDSHRTRTAPVRTRRCSVRCPVLISWNSGARSGARCYILIIHFEILKSYKTFCYLNIPKWLILKDYSFRKPILP